MLQQVGAIAQLAVGLVFLFSGAGKLRDVRVFSIGLRDYRILPPQFVGVASILVIGGELAIAVSHVTGLLVDIAAPTAVALLTLLLFVVLRALRRGDPVRCLCFGGRESISTRSLVRLVALTGVEVGVCVLVLSRGDPLFSYRSTPTGIGLSVFEACLVLVAVRWCLRVPDLLVLLTANRRRALCSHRGNASSSVAAEAT